MFAGGASFAGLVRDRLLQGSSQVAVPALRAAVSHLLGRGKLYRPQLAYAAFRACGGEEDTKVLDSACALELVHTFTLVHDDLPCMDDSHLRRGMPAVHVAHGEAEAVLAGDALLNMAYRRVLECESLEAPAILAILQVLSTAVHEVVEGQAVDIQTPAAPVDRAALAATFRWKTGALLGAACEIGGIAAGAGPSVCTDLACIGRDCGVLFQIRDDLLAYTATEASAGKPLDADVVAGKSTALTVLGYEEAHAWASELKDALLRRIEGAGLVAPEGLGELVMQAYDRGF